LKLPLPDQIGCSLPGLGCMMFVKRRTTCRRVGKPVAYSEQTRNLRKGCGSVLQWFPIGRGKGDPPEIGGRLLKFHGDQESFRGALRRAGHTHRFALSRHLVLDFKSCFRRQVDGRADHGAVDIDGNRIGGNGFRLSLRRVVEHERDADHYALATPAALVQGIVTAAGMNGLGEGLHGAHSSSPQKSISGSINSIPYSQPSTRSLPFHTITPGLDL
jgi:hypothetical protein